MSRLGGQIASTRSGSTAEYSLSITNQKWVIPKFPNERLMRNDYGWNQLAGVKDQPLIVQQQWTYVSSTTSIVINYI